LIQRKPAARRFAGLPEYGTSRHIKQFRKSSDQPSPTVNIEFHHTFVAHFQQQRLANFLIRDIGASHDLAHLERLLA
jgi:phosphopantetheine adenylyltransferase